MKRLICNMLTLCLVLCLFSPLTAYAVGDGNIDGGGGGMGSGTSTNSWSPGNDGVRVTVVRASDHAQVTTPIDLTNKTPSAGMYHFGKVSKLQYNSGVSLSPMRGGYSFKNPAQQLPRIVSSSGTNNIAAIKSYFTDEQVIRAIARLTGMNYDILINGEYKLLLEPFAFV